MSRTLSSNMLTAIFKQETSECLLFLVEIDHASWANPVRIVNNNVDVVSGGNTYTAYPFEITLPADDPDIPQPQTKIKVDNVDRQITALFNALSTKPTVTISLVLGSSPSTIEFGPAAFIVTDYGYDIQSVEVTLSYENVLNELVPSGTFNPANFSGLH